MEEAVQLNLIEEESIILQAIVAVGITLRVEHPTVEMLEDLKRRIISMKVFMYTWPEAGESLAGKMSELVKISAETIGVELPK